MKKMGLEMPTISEPVKGSKNETIKSLLKRMESLEIEQQNVSKRLAEIQKSGEFREQLLELMKVVKSLEIQLLKNEDQEDSELINAAEEEIKSNNLSQALSLLVDWLRKQLEDNRIRDARQTDQAAKAHYEMPTVFRPRDGKLITLTKEDVEGILRNCDPPIRGGFGEAHVSSTKVPGLDLRVVIKRIVVDKEDEIKMLSASNEKIATRVMHFAIVPLIAYMDDFLEHNKRVFYFLSPYLEGGNLQKVIAKDKRCSDTKEIQLKQQRRIEILFQVASALKYLHTEVPNYRGKILHMDLTSSNIVLDRFMNARIIDFGLAREMNEGQNNVTESKCLGTPGYYPTSRYSKLTVHEDYYNFGVVIRELLTGEAPYIEDGSGSSELRKFDESLIKKKIQHNGPTNFTTVDEDKCHICIVNRAGTHSLQHECRIKLCVSCMRNSHVNPIKCPVCNKDVIPKTGHTTAALLIAGNDIKDAELVNSFKNEIKEIRSVLVSKYPCVIGCREENVRIVAPSNPGKPEQLFPNLSKEIECLKSSKGLETLLLYFTGHHFPSGFHLGGPDDILTVGYLQQALMQISQEWGSQTRIIVFLDCCRPPSVAESIPELSDSSLKIIQLNACRSCETSDQPQSGSTFQKFFVQALTRRSFNKQCHNTTTTTTAEKKCKDCKMTGDFFSIEKLLEYISDHMKNRSNGKQPVKYTNGITWLDSIIGYNVDFVINYEFKFGEQSKQVILPHRIFHDLNDLKKTILENVIANNEEQPTEKLTPVEFSDAIALRIHSVSEDGQELRSMLNVSSAMDGKREIVASYRMVSNILNAPVVLFVPTRRIIQYFDDKKLFEQRASLIDESRKRVTLSLSDFDIVTDEVAEITDLAEIHRCLLKVYEKWTLKANGERKELKITFPCLNDDNWHDMIVLDLTIESDSSPKLKQSAIVSFLTCWVIVMVRIWFYFLRSMKKPDLLTQ